MNKIRRRRSDMGRWCQRQGNMDHSIHVKPSKRMKTHKSDDEIEVKGQAPIVKCDDSSSGVLGREKLKRHRVEVAGQVWIPDTWGQEELLKDWIDCSAFDASLVPTGIMLARAALAEEGKRGNSNGLMVKNRC